MRDDFIPIIYSVLENSYFHISVRFVFYSISIEVFYYSQTLLCVHDFIIEMFSKRDA